MLLSQNCLPCYFLIFPTKNSLLQILRHSHLCFFLLKFKTDGFPSEDLKLKWLPHKLCQTDMKKHAIIYSDILKTDNGLIWFQSRTSPFYISPIFPSQQQVCKMNKLRQLPSHSSHLILVIFSPSLNLFHIITKESSLSQQEKDWCQTRAVTVFNTCLHYPTVTLPFYPCVTMASVMLFAYSHLKGHKVNAETLCKMKDKQANN